MLGLEYTAVKVSDIRSVGAAGFGNDTKMVTLALANMKLKEVLDANQTLRDENDKWSKEISRLMTENASLKKQHGRSQ
jgi:hypothetical protein